VLQIKRVETFPDISNWHLVKDCGGRFREKHDLNFPLLADTDHEVAQAYGVWREKKNYGKTYVGLVRSTFFIDEEGTIEKIYDNVRATGHVERLVRELG